MWKLYAIIFQMISEFNWRLALAWVCARSVRNFQRIQMHVTISLGELHQVELLDFNTKRQ
jgi:hypothetical protein